MARVQLPLSLVLFAFAQADCYDELVDADAALINPHPALKVVYSEATEDPLIARARELDITKDFKTLADLVPLPHSASEKADIEASAHKKFPGKENEKYRVQFLLDSLYVRESPLENADPAHMGATRSVTGSTLRKSAFAYTEAMLRALWKQTPQSTRNSLIPVPHPFLIAGARFTESYYWDSYFGMQGLLATGRQDIAKMQIDNFLFLIDNYGHIPNGIRSYYLSRSQPPVISSMVMDYLKSLKQITPADREWAQNALKLLEKDYKTFWMTPNERLVESTGLNRHRDNKNEARPERWGEDDETKLGKTFRDVRAEAESGKDFTIAFNGEITNHNPVMLNSLLYKYESDLAELNKILGNTANSRAYKKSAENRYASFNKLLWNEERGNYFDYNFETQKHSPVLTADVYSALWEGLVPPERLARFMQTAQALHGKGGVVSSQVESGKQWDAPYAWAPHQFFAVQGLLKNGFVKEAKELASRWTTTVEKIFEETGLMFEKLDGVNGELPVDKSGKYPNQPGFLWTNSVYTWMLGNVFNEDISP